MNIDLVLVDPRLDVVTAWQRAFHKHTRIHVIQGASLFKLPVPIDAYVLGTSAAGALVAPDTVRVQEDTMMQRAYARLRSALGVQSMLNRPCLPIGFAAMLTPFFERPVATKPHAIVTSVRFTDDEVDTDPGDYGAREAKVAYADRTTNVYHALLATLRLILDYNAQCDRLQDRIYSVACPNLCPTMSLREQAQQIYRAFTTATRRDVLPGHFIHQRFYVPDTVACGAQTRHDAHLEFEPFFDGYLAPRSHRPMPMHASPPPSDSASWRHYGRKDGEEKEEDAQSKTKRLHALNQKRGEVALARWRHVTG